MDQNALDDAAWRLLFLDAHTHNGWVDREVRDEELRRLYELLRMAPTSTNSQPVRLVFVKSPAAKKRLEPALFPNNVEKTMAAPVTAIVAWDTAFYEKLGALVPHRPGMDKQMAAMPEEKRTTMAVQSATLQAGYLIIAARGLGLDCGPMGGFDAAKVDAAFFPDGRWKTLLLVNLGHGEPSKVRPRAPRLSFDEACRIE